MSNEEREDADGHKPVLRLEFYLDQGKGEDSEFSFARLASFARPEDKLPAEQQATEKQLTDLACQIYESRRVRARFLNGSLLGEPVWDMLLALYCFAARGEVLSVSGLCHAAGVPPTTALRWSQIMEQKKLIHRTKDNKDARRAYVALTADGKRAMSEYLSAIHKKLTEKE
jgi:DNA-binding MarR family transcriptional regulator